ncbi:MAG: DUF1638 domain-containing protein [Desulfosalsimonadaceae bacterium]
MSETLYEQYGLDRDHPRVVIACRVMKTEIDALLPADAPIEVHYLDQNLHRTPEKMGSMIEEKIAEVADYAAHIVLGYGLCSNGVVGTRAVNQEICIPRVHDCIALMLGSRQAYHDAFSARAGTYYLTAGWVAEEKDPLGTLENEYVPKMGREDAEWGLREELKHYTHIVLIGSRGGHMEELRKRAIANADFLGMQYTEVDGSDRYFRKILFGPYDPADFVCVPPGETIPQKPFLQG